MYEGGGGVRNRCPGPSSCSIYLGAANDPAEREAACAQQGDYCAKAFYAQASSDEVVARIERIVQERRAGFEWDDDPLSTLDRQLIVIWHECERTKERMFQSGLHELLEIMKARFKVGL